MKKKKKTINFLGNHWHGINFTGSKIKYAFHNLIQQIHFPTKNIIFNNNSI